LPRFGFRVRHRGDDIFWMQEVFLVLVLTNLRAASLTFAKVTRNGRCRMKFDLGVQSPFAQGWQRSMLALTKQARFGAGQHERVTVSQLWGQECGDSGLKDLRKPRVAVIGERLGPELHLPRGRGKPRGFPDPSFIPCFV
jgi:hypothetical protein